MDTGEWLLSALVHKYCFGKVSSLDPWISPFACRMPAPAIIPLSAESEVPLLLVWVAVWSVPLGRTPSFSLHSVLELGPHLCTCAGD